MDRSARGWLFNTARQHYWRVAPWYDLEDLIQDGFLHWQRVCNRYPLFSSRMHIARHRRRIMSLFQTTYLNHITDLANQRTEEPVVPETHPGYEGEPCGYAELLQLASEAPWPANMVLRSLLTDEGAKRLGDLFRVRTDGSRETMNERLCLIAGIDSAQIDMAKQLRDYLRSP